MVTAKLYIEGGGDNRHPHAKDLTKRFREGWKEFFNSAGVGRRTQIVRGGGRDQTFDRFVTAAADPPPGIVPLLLVDSEDPVEMGRSVWQHLKARDDWNRPISAGGDGAFLMVQVMETWFLADRDTLRSYFGAQFAENALKQWTDLEQVPKRTVLDALDRATAKCPKRYAKGKVSFELLAQVDPARVEAACPHAKALLDRLKSL